MPLEGTGRRRWPCVALAVGFSAALGRAQDDPKDWPTYNRDVLGTRHNAAEKDPRPVQCRPPRNVGDPVASGIAAGGGVLCLTTVASGKLVVLDAAGGSDVGPVWSGPSISRGRVYVGTGNTLFVERTSRSVSRRASSTPSASPARTRSPAWARGRSSPGGP